MAEIRINETGTLKLFDADDSHSAGIAAGTITSDVTAMTLNNDSVAFIEDIKLTDNNKALFGDDGDFEVYHSGSASIVREAGAGNLVLAGNDVNITNGAMNETHIDCNQNGSVDLYHDNSVKLQTSSTGIDITGAFTATSGSTITTADNTDTLTLTSTDDDASSGPNLRMYRNSSSPANSDILGVLEYEGRNDNSEDIRYVQITSFADDVSDGTEDGSYFISTSVAGTLRNRINVRPTETVFNEESQDLDFRVESDTYTHALFVDGDKHYVGIRDSLSGSDSVGSSSYVQLVFGNSNLNDSTGSNSALHLNQNAYQGTSNNNYFTVGSGSSWAGQMMMTTGRFVFNNKNGGTADSQVSWTELFRIASNGDLTAIDTSIGSNSDERLKKDITNYSYDISKFKQFQPRTFNWKNPEEHGDKTNVRGFVAQELELIDNYWVGETEIENGPDRDLLDEDNISKTAKLGQKDAMYISVIQQLITRIEALEDA